MRLITLITLVLLAPLTPASANNDFSGAWVAWLCPNGVQRDSGNCSNFVLELHQKDDKLCGAHFFATTGAERVDEGKAPSLMGEIVNDIATVTAISTRAAPPVKVRVEVKKSNGMLHWLRLENPAGDYLLPQSTRLTRSRSRTLFAPVFEQELKAACMSAFAMAAESERRAQTSVPAPGSSVPSGHTTERERERADLQAPPVRP